MHPRRAELAAIEGSLSSLSERIAEMAKDEATRPEGERLSAELHAVEALLRSGTRRLGTIVRKLG